MVNIEFIGILGSGKSTTGLKTAELSVSEFLPENFEGCEFLKQQYKREQENQETGETLNPFLLKTQYWFLNQILKDEKECKKSRKASYVRDGNLTQCLAYIYTAYDNHKINSEELATYIKTFHLSFKNSITRDEKTKVFMLDTEPKEVLKRIQIGS